MIFPSEFTSFSIQVSPEITIAGTRGPQTGTPLLLIHGYPHSHHIWEYMAPHLANDYTLIMPDIRGYGASSKPPSSADHAAYGKTAMAGDLVTLMEGFGFKEFYVCAHDRGARMTHAMCISHPNSVKKAILLDISPTLKMFSSTNAVFASAYFHWFFLSQPSPFPESLINANPFSWLEYTNRTREPGMKVSDETWAMYTKYMQDPEAVRASCEDYRAAATLDCKEQKEQMQRGDRIRCDLRVLWGKEGVVEKLFDCVGDWKEVCEGEVTGEAVPGGHYIPGNCPDIVVRHVKEFFVE